MADRSGGRWAVVTDDTQETVIDFCQALRRRQQGQCLHKNVEVSFESADLSCIDCGAPMDPWTYIRALCDETHTFCVERLAKKKEMDEWLEKVRRIELEHTERIARLNAEVNRLTEIWYELANRSVDGRLLVHIARRPVRRKR